MGWTWYWLEFASASSIRSCLSRGVKKTVNNCQRPLLAVRLGHLNHLAKLCRRTVILFAGFTITVVRTCLVMIKPVFLAPEVQLTVVTNPMLLGVCQMTLRRLVRNEKSITAMAPRMAIRFVPMAL